MNDERLTYRQLANLINSLTEEQKDKVVRVDIEWDFEFAFPIAMKVDSDNDPIIKVEN